ETLRVERYRLEARIVHADEILEPGRLRQLAVALVLRLAEIHARDAATGMPSEPARGAAIAGAGIEHAAAGTETGKTASHRLHRALGSHRDWLLVGLVEPDVNVFAAPDVEVEVVRVAAVVVVAGGSDDLGVARAHDEPSPSSSVLTYFFSATWMKKSGSLSRYVS